MTQKHNLKDLDGAFGEDSDEWDKIEKELYEDRLKPSSREEVTFEKMDRIYGI